MYKAKVAVYSDIRTKHSSQSEHHVEFFNVFKVFNVFNVRKETARLYKVNKSHFNLFSIRTAGQ
jgi:hypothetical protein